MADSQKMGSKVSSGGERIDNHAFWAGGRSKGSVFPEGAKTTDTGSEEGAGSVMRYEDTDSAIKNVQSQGVKHLKGRPLKPGYRN
jgi:hypothetical protein